MQKYLLLAIAFVSNFAFAEEPPAEIIGCTVHRTGYSNLNSEIKKLTSSSGLSVKNRMSWGTEMTPVKEAQDETYATTMILDKDSETLLDIQVSVTKISMKITAKVKKMNNGVVEVLASGVSSTKAALDDTGKNVETRLGLSNPVLVTLIENETPTASSLDSKTFPQGHYIFGGVNIFCHTNFK